MRIVLATLLLCLAAAPVLAAPVCAARDAAAPALQRLQSAMEEGRFVAYQPTGLKIWDGNPVPASAESIRADLRMLRPWFDGLITYGAHSGAERIPAIAAELGYRAVIIGVWDVTSGSEIDAALAAWKAHPDIVLGVSLGNEVILGKRGSWEALEAAVAGLHEKAPALPVTTTEPFAEFLAPEAAPLLAGLDFMSVNIHPVFEPWFAGAPPFNWADFVVKVSDRLSAEAFCGPVLVKETGIPTAPAEAGFTPEKQTAFWTELAAQMPPSRKRAFAYFSAFDAPWRVYDASPVAGTHPEEAHWGLFTETRAPKPVMDAIPELKK